MPVTVLPYDRPRTIPLKMPSVFLWRVQALSAMPMNSSGLAVAVTHTREIPHGNLLRVCALAFFLFHFHVRVQ